MAKHDLALKELRSILNSVTANSKYAADRRIWLRDNIRFDTEHGKTPDPAMVKERDEMTETVKSNYKKIESLIGSIGVLEEDNA